MRVELRRIQREFNTTTVYVTHDQVEATTLADRACIMNQGVVVQMGPPLDLYNLPYNTFVATFVGDPPMNLLDGNLLGKNGKAILEVSGANIQLNDIKIDDGAKIEVKIGVRPEDLTINDEGIEATLVVSQNIGKSIYEYFKSVDGFDLTKQDVSTSHLSPGEKCKLMPNIEKLMLFDPVNGKLIYKYGEKKLNLNEVSLKS